MQITHCKATGSFLIVLVLLFMYPGGATALDCSRAISIECGREYMGNTSDGKAETETYCFMDTNIWKGNEVIFKIEISKRTDLSMTVLNPDPRDVLFNLFLVDDCYPEPCISMGREYIEATDLSPGIYYIILDSDTSGFDYHVRVECGPMVPYGSGYARIFVLWCFTAIILVQLYLPFRPVNYSMTG